MCRWYCGYVLKHHYLLKIHIKECIRKIIWCLSLRGNSEQWRLLKLRKSYGSIIFFLFLCASENFHSTKLKRNPHLTHIPFCFYNKLFEMVACTSPCLFFVTSCLFCNQVNLAFSWPLSWNHSFQGHQENLHFGKPSGFQWLWTLKLILQNGPYSPSLKHFFLFLFLGHYNLLNFFWPSGPLLKITC